MQRSTTFRMQEQGAEQHTEAWTKDLDKNVRGEDKKEYVVRVFGCNCVNVCARACARARFRLHLRFGSDSVSVFPYLCLCLSCVYFFIPVFLSIFLGFCLRLRLCLCSRLYVRVHVRKCMRAPEISRVMLI